MMSFPREVWKVQFAILGKNSCEAALIASGAADFRRQVTFKYEDREMLRENGEW